MKNASHVVRLCRSRAAGMAAQTFGRKTRFASRAEVLTKLRRKEARREIGDWR